jgi:hypothetical protein
MEFDDFDWDEGNWPKCSQHGVGRLEIEDLFRLGFASIFPDPRHSVYEVRQVAVGQIENGRWLLVVFVERDHQGAHLIRPVSARYMHTKEVSKYV